MPQHEAEIAAQRPSSGAPNDHSTVHAYARQPQTGNEFAPRSQVSLATLCWAVLASQVQLERWLTTNQQS